VRTDWLKLRHVCARGVIADAGSLEGLGAEAARQAAPGRQMRVLLATMLPATVKRIAWLP